MSVKHPVQRVEALGLISRQFPNDPVVFTCGSTSREMASTDRRENHLYVVDSMGLVSSIVLGLSLGLAKDSNNISGRKVVGVEGDGGMLMNLNALTTIGYLQPPNLLLVVLDNQSYESTGGQYTFTTRLDLAEIARSCGLRTWQPDDLEGFQQALTDAAENPSPAFVHLRIAPGHAPAPLLLEDPVTLGYRFNRWLHSAAG